jgi:hypothetical protein
VQAVYSHVGFVSQVTVPGLRLLPALAEVVVERSHDAPHGRAGVTEIRLCDEAFSPQTIYILLYKSAFRPWVRPFVHPDVCVRVCVSVCVSVSVCFDPPKNTICENSSCKCSLVCMYLNFTDFGRYLRVVTEFSDSQSPVCRNPAGHK